MGSGASTERNSLKPLLLSQELVEGSTALVSDTTFRVSFTNYIKSGIWLDRLSQLIPDFQSGSNVAGNEVQHILHEYGVDIDKLSRAAATSYGRLSPIPSFQNSSKSTAFDGYGDLYSGETTSFNHEELLIILFTILYPIYLSSKEFERFMRYGIEHGHGKGTHDENSSRSYASVTHRGTHLVQTNQSKRAQELLLGCAAYYEESFLQEYLQEPSWLQRICPIFQDHQLALCITDAAKSDPPILFANAAFCSMFGFTESELLGESLSILHSPSTELAQLQLMQSSIHSTETVKFSISLQNKSKKPLLDLVAQKAVGAYSVSAHFDGKKTTSAPATLHMVDDVLILLSYLVKAPALPVKPSWLPAPIVILAQAASNAISPSPASSRSRSRTSSLSLSSRSRLFNRFNKNTPTSGRSTRSGSSGSSAGNNLAATTASCSSSVHSGSYRTMGTQPHMRPTHGADATSPMSLHSFASAQTTTETDCLYARQSVSVDGDASMECSMAEHARKDGRHTHK